MVKVREILKAISAGATAGVAALTTAAADGSVTQLEWVIVVGSVLAGLGIVYGVPNKSPQQ